MKHRWMVLAQKYGIERYRCKVCQCMKTVTKGGERLPVTRYDLGGKSFLNAPVCIHNDEGPLSEALTTAGS